MCVDMGGGGGVHTFGKGGLAWGFTKKKVGSQGVHKKGVHVNPVNPTGYGPGICKNTASKYQLVSINV